MTMNQRQNNACSEQLVCSIQQLVLPVLPFSANEQNEGVKGVIGRTAAILLFLIDPILQI